MCTSASQGIFFQCTKCGKCCSNSSEGFIFIFWEDIKKISSQLNLSYKEFAKKYLTITKYNFPIWDENLEELTAHKAMETLALDFGVDQNCIFLIENGDFKGCKVYKNRPKQCKLYPFWSIVMTSERNFRYHEKFCPGINPKNSAVPFFHPETIEKLIKIERKIEHNYYLQMKKNDFDLFRMYPFLQNLSKFRINK
ncbi:MAG: YkgJ family cysteine cluster protein [Promethearchaeota archaeon]